MLHNPEPQLAPAARSSQISTDSLDEWLQKTTSQPGGSWALSLHDHEQLAFLIPFLRARLQLHQPIKGSASEQRRVDLIVLPNSKALKTYRARHHSEHAPLLCWPSIDCWSEHSTHRPMVELQQRMSTLFHLLHTTHALNIITTATALHETTWPPQLLQRYSLSWSRGQSLSGSDLEQRLSELGYMPAAGSVSSYGTYVLRGDVCDVLPPGYPHPLRLNLRQGQLSHVRYFSLASGRSLKTVEDTITLFPVGEMIFPQDQGQREIYAAALHKIFLQQKVQREERTAVLDSVHRGEVFPGCDRYAFSLRPLLAEGGVATLHDYLTSQHLWLWHTLSAEAAREHLQESEAASHSGHQWQRAHGLATLPPQGYRRPWKDVTVKLQRATHVCLEHAQPHLLRGQIFLREFLLSPLQSQWAGSQKDREGLGQFLHEILRSSPASRRTSVLVYTQQWQVEELQSLCEHLGRELPPQLPEMFDERLWSPSATTAVWLVAGELRRDYQLAYEGIHWIPLVWLLPSGQPKKTQNTKDREQQWQNYLQSLSDIAPGDLVVHRDHGVGCYEGLHHISLQGHEVECLKIQYAGGDRIYLPVESIALLQKHSSPASGESVHRHLLDSLSRRGKVSWQKRRNRIKKSLVDVAQEILRTQSRRELKPWPPYGPPGAEYQSFVDAFTHIETKDQQRFCLDLEEDFTSSRSMDRLLIGDVGFGKTEMAMRAAMRSVLEGYQVMVLCPTTVLCYQHSDTWQKRFRGFEVKLASVSRFTSAVTLRQVQQQFAAGKIHILIGTHKLLGKGFEPHRLGLVIVDEEQRFGVAHKEKIKSLRSEAGVLCLSATPIPRTMHMSMVGLRDISLLTTPPAERLAVKNLHISWCDNTIKEALHRELRRGGQVFFVHNRVQELESYARRLRELVPEQEVRMAHGQMQEAQLEEVLMDFLRGTFSILVCTTIMESGVDMPHVNTILINRAESFGLSQLYQLRGRVGRSGVQAYAYLITGSKSQLNAEARQRIQVMMNHQQLGSGFSIASYDMDLRGVGDLLGEDQSGHLSTVGVEMYTRMLAEAVKKARGELQQEDAEPCELKLRCRYELPPHYIKEDRDRLRLYKRLFSLNSAHKLADLGLEMEDLYGEFPQEVEQLFEVALLRLTLKKLSVHSLVEVVDHLFALEIHQLPQDLLGAVIAKFSSEPEIFSFDDARRLRVDLRRQKPKNPIRLLRRKLQSLLYAPNHSGDG